MQFGTAWMATDRRTFLAVERSLFDDPLYRAEKFSKWQAMIDLARRAEYRPRTVDIGHRRIELRRGDVLTSQVKLAADWRWNRETVRVFLRYLERRGDASIRTSKATETGHTIITLLKYEELHGFGVPLETNGSSIGTDIQSSIRPASVQHPSSTTNKEYKSNLVNNEVCVSSSTGNNHRAYYREDQDDGFAAFWERYPKKWGGHETEARAAWQELRPEPALQRAILSGLDEWCDEWDRVGPRYAPPAARWLSDRRWETAPLPDAPLMGMGKFD
jgi:hypothetical protein